ncbi:MULTISPECIES: hypothetical protein [Galbibacter]|uniref:hypothetical protein n=1 Tax=Galbibacter orientalis TaxID=453852 RepID=UPI0030010F96
MFEKIFTVVKSIFSTSDIGKEILQLFKGKEAKLREFQYKIAEQMYKEHELEVKDLERATQMQIQALKQNDTFSKRFIYYLAGFVLVASVVLPCLPLFIDIPEAVLRSYERTTDFFHSVVTSVIAFFFGTKFNRLKIPFSK